MHFIMMLNVLFLCNWYQAQMVTCSGICHKLKVL